MISLLMGSSHLHPLYCLRFRVLENRRTNILIVEGGVFLSYQYLFSLFNKNDYYSR